MSSDFIVACTRLFKVDDAMFPFSNDLPVSFFLLHKSGAIFAKKSDFCKFTPEKKSDKKAICAALYGKKCRKGVSGQSDLRAAHDALGLCEGCRRAGIPDCMAGR